YFLLNFFVSYVGKMRFDIVKSLEGGFEEAMVGYLFLVNMLPLILVPMMWLETRKIAQVLNGWSDFELCYQRVSGKVLPIKMHSKSLFISILIPIMSTMSVVVTHVTMVEFHVFQVIPYCFLDTLTYMLGAYWYLMCGVIGETATEVAEDFQVALRHIGPAALVADYRGLWLRLSRMTRDTGLATCYTFTFINLYLFLIITLSIYGLMSKINDGFGTKDIGLALTACCSVCLPLFFICDEAHYASSNVQTNFQKKLLMVNLSWMNIAGQTEVHQFLRATEMNPSNISLGGFFYVNRNLFKSLLATMVTYLVVLLQFQISIPTELGVPVDENTTMSSNIN
ncbi:LOW QUALITY PROTEIN: gustatory and odorant receptor 24-like, partial [Ctenocephalides felis]|uniref:LOW QUALITY PROTEIN: gustatory and odorant receptor 24-like n=1 Tax=Ctenocephalides felis TaxID=7515 RepID=UPI000E6E548B